MDSIRVCVLVSTDPSDIYFANQMVKKLNVVGIVVENQNKPSTKLKKIKKGLTYAVNPWKIPGKLKSNGVLSKYYDKARVVDLENFGVEMNAIIPNDKCKAIYTSEGKGINDSVYLTELKQLNPDIIVVCGTSILKEPILRLPKKGVLNLHGGLSQEYRGVWTTLWAMYNKEPEYVGATVHYVSSGIDDGNIIFQGRPDIEAGDDPELLYVKVVKLGIKMMLKAVEDIAKGEVRGYSPSALGKLYLSKSVTPDVIKKAWENSESDVIKNYLDEKSNRDKKVIAIMQGAFHV